MPPRTDPLSPAAAARGGFTFFFYGTLCDADVRVAVIGRAVDAVPATLADHEAVPVAGGRFPILFFQRGLKANGVLCAGLSLAEAARLGLYEHEGRDYAARSLPVRAEGNLLHAWVFVPTQALRRGPGRWDLGEWQRFAKRTFLADAQRRMRGIEPKELEPYFEIWRKRLGAGA